MLSAGEDTNRIQNSQTLYRWVFPAGWFHILLISLPESILEVKRKDFILLALIRFFKTYFGDQFRIFFPMLAILKRRLTRKTGTAIISKVYQ
jgi:hypothetical protein